MIIRNRSVAVELMLLQQAWRVTTDKPVLAHGCSSYITVPVACQICDTNYRGIKASKVRLILAAEQVSRQRFAVRAYDYEESYGCAFQT